MRIYIYREFIETDFCYVETYKQSQKVKYIKQPKNDLFVYSLNIIFY